MSTGGRRRKHKGGEGGHENSERWLLTYADLITLLMVFFVVLYSMSSADSTKWQEVSASLQQAFNVDVLQGQAATSISDAPVASSAGAQDSLISDSEVPQAARIQSQITAVLANTTQSPDVTVGVDTEGVVIRLSGSYLFDSGRAELKPNSLAVLDAIANEIRPLENDVRVEGHTDSLPINSPRFATNWELSVARSVAVARYLTETDGIQADRLEAAGFGEFRPLVPNDTREHRAQNRRVEIHLLSSVPPSAASSAATPLPTPIPTPTNPNTENIQQ